jgi:hypothetical protein
VVNTLNLFCNGPVGFIDWLSLRIVKHLEEITDCCGKAKKQKSDCDQIADVPTRLLQSMGGGVYRPRSHLPPRRTAE